MKLRQRKINLLGVLVLLGTFVLAWQWMELSAFADSPLNLQGESVTFVIKPGKTLKHIARELQHEGIIQDARKLVWLARLQGTANHIRVGEYEFKPGTTVEQMLDKVVKGDVKQYSLTLVEGWNFRQMMAAMNADTVLDHKLIGLNQVQIMNTLGHTGQHPEGRFFPDTYQFSRGMTDVDILKQAYERMKSTLEAEWETRQAGLPYENAYQALTMASIVEKETGVPEERLAIAGVFVRRLEKGMRLQTDPTVIYGLGEKFDGNLKRSHLLDAANPYNTYKHKGLPPTPIAMPGRDSIHAALHPEAGTALYFVSRGNGSHYFSSTLEEHNRAVVKYQLKGKLHSTTSMNADGSARQEK